MVDLAEVVEVEEEERERSARAPSAREFALELLVVAATVADAREPVGDGAELGLGEAARVRDPERGIVRERLERARVLGPERGRSARVRDERPGVDAVLDDRDDQRRAVGDLVALERRGIGPVERQRTDTAVRREGRAPLRGARRRRPCRTTRSRA